MEARLHAEKRYRAFQGAPDNRPNSVACMPGPRTAERACQAGAVLGHELRLFRLQALQDARVALQQAQQRAHRVPRRLVACRRGRAAHQHHPSPTGLCKHGMRVRNSGLERAPVAP